MTHLGDTTQINGAFIEPVDCIIGGSPCQDLSIAGKRAGLAGARSGLYMEQVRIIKEMRDADANRGRTGQFIRPRYMVWENVPGAFSSNKGRDFAAVIEEAIHIIEPQAPSIDVPKHGWPTWGGYRDMGGRWSLAWRVLDAQYWGVPQRRRRIALIIDFGGDTAHEILFNRESVSWNPAESEGTRRTSPETAGSGADRADKLPCAVRIRGGCDGGGKGALVQTDKSGTLGTGNDQTIFCVKPAILDMTHACDVIRECGNIVPSLQSRMGTGGNQVPLCYGIGNGQVNEASLMVPEKAQTLNTMHDAQGVLQVETMTVRRLTPLECERLQGFPDGWTDIGDWVDGKGRTRESKDAPRYRALGNSIALPPWKWVLKRLCANYERDATLGSLFDGIGGFPYLWEQLNGKGSARWASEIEEFPMAVTKIRIGGDEIDQRR